MAGPAHDGGQPPHRPSYEVGQPYNAEEAAALGRTVQTEEAERFAANIMPVVRSIQAAGIRGMVSIAKALNDRGVRTARGGRWHVSTVANLLARSAKPAEV